jgi:hypothetical protein
MRFRMALATRILGTLLAVVVILHPGAVLADQWVDWVNTATPAPPCKNSASRCQPWERDWRNRNFPAGAFVTDLDVIVPAEPSRAASFFYDWQTLITGFLAIIAALIGAGAAFCVGRSQVAEARRKEHRQALCLAVALMPELLQLQVSHERAVQIISADLFTINSGNVMTQTIVSMIIAAKIAVPPLLDRNTEDIYTLGKAGSTLLQLLSVMLQYNSMVDILADNLRLDVNSFNPANHSSQLTDQLTVIGRNISESQLELAPLHDEATVAG